MDSYHSHWVRRVNGGVITWERYIKDCYCKCFQPNYVSKSYKNRLKLEISNRVLGTEPYALGGCPVESCFKDLLTQEDTQEEDLSEKFSNIKIKNFPHRDVKKGMRIVKNRKDKVVDVNLDSDEYGDVLDRISYIKF